MEEGLFQRQVREGAENAGVSIICRSDFSREYRQFATKVTPTNICKFLCVLSVFVCFALTDIWTFSM